MRKHYIALVQAGPSAYGVSFPDFPGVVTAARTIDAAVAGRRHQVLAGAN
jgi:predicted RNase H-like HicB family nuclease